MSELLKNLDKPITPEIALYGMMFVGLVFASFALFITWNDYMEDRKATQKSN